MTGSGLELPAHFSPIYFPIGNAATGFFVIFAVIAGVVGAAAALAGFHHVRAWSPESLPAAVSSGFMAWTLTLLAMGYVLNNTNNIRTIPSPWGTTYLGFATRFPDICLVLLFQIGHQGD